MKRGRGGDGGGTVGTQRGGCVGGKKKNSEHVLANLQQCVYEYYVYQVYIYLLYIRRIPWKHHLPLLRFGDLGYAYIHTRTMYEGMYVNMYEACICMYVL